MEVKIKKLHQNAVIPHKAHATDAGFDLTAVSLSFDGKGNFVYGTGLAFEIPEGHVGLVFPRSSICKTDLFLTNSVGVIDSHYRGEVTFKFKTSIRSIGLWSYLKFNLARKCKRNGMSLRVDNHSNNGYKVGDRIGQMIILPYPEVEFNEVEELSETDRGVSGYGSSGR